MFFAICFAEMEIYGNQMRWYPRSNCESRRTSNVAFVADVNVISISMDPLVTRTIQYNVRNFLSSLISRRTYNLPLPATKFVQFLHGSQEVRRVCVGFNRFALFPDSFHVSLS